MEKITRKPLSDLPDLVKLYENWEAWGREFKTYIDGGKTAGIGVRFSWRQGIREPLVTALSSQTAGHCSFCDTHSVGEGSDETIEHYQPKEQFPLAAYKWENLYYCCRNCQNAANSLPFQETLRPDAEGFSFDAYFYYDAEEGEVKVLEDLPSEDAIRAAAYLERYGINKYPKRKQLRKNEWSNIIHALRDPNDDRTRDDFPYRWVYDCVAQSIVA